MKGRVILACAAFLLLLPATASAGPEDLANDIAATVMSPFCPGVTLHDCPSRAALDLRREITGWAERGWSRDRILDRLEDDYGSIIRATPPASGTGLLAWVLPGIALGAGAIAFWILVRRFAGRGGAAPETTAAISADERMRLDAELARYRGDA